MALLFQLTQKVSQGFTAVWSRWPRKEAKKDAEKAWKQVDPSPDLEDTIHQALDWQVPMLLEREPKYRPLLATWLRGERWNDEPPMPAKPKSPMAPPRFMMTAAQQTAEVIRLMKTEGLSRPDAIAKVFNETRGDS